MKEITGLFFKSEVGTPCEGCTVLQQSKPVHCYIDDEEKPECDVLFLVDSANWNYYGPEHFNENQTQVFTELVGETLKNVRWDVVASIKCPGVKEDDLTTDDKNKCRNYLEESVRKLKPRLIIPIGNLALVMLTKRSGIDKKSGRSLEYEIDGKAIPVVPVQHLTRVYLEPRLREQFRTEVANAIDKYVRNKTRKFNISYEIIESYEALEKYAWLKSTDKTISIDLETEGLNFLTHKILTVAISWGEHSIVIPISHKENPIDPEHMGLVIGFIRNVCSNLHNKKVFHNAKFDLKFLKKINVEVVNVWDTKLMKHSLDELARKGLKDLVIEYFPEYVEDF